MRLRSASKEGFLNLPHKKTRAYHWSVHWGNKERILRGPNTLGAVRAERTGKKMRAAKSHFSGYPSLHLSSVRNGIVPPIKVASRTVFVHSVYFWKRRVLRVGVRYGLWSGLRFINVSQLKHAQITLPSSSSHYINLVLGTTLCKVMSSSRIKPLKIS